MSLPEYDEDYGNSFDTILWLHDVVVQADTSHCVWSLVVTYS
jgi:hypothetical protein